MDFDQINALASGLVFTSMLAFARIGTAILMMPGFGDARIPGRIRIGIAIVVSLFLTPTLPEFGPVEQPSILVRLIAFEVTVGVFIATAAKLFLAVIHVLGAKIGQAAGLSNAFAPNDGNFASASTISGFLYMGALVIMFATNTHHLMISGILRSYQAIPIGTLPVIDMAQQIARIGADIFYISAFVGAPFLLFTVLFNLALGLANRVMPSMQVFFVAAPAMIILGLSILALALPMILFRVNDELASWLLEFVR